MLFRSGENLFEETKKFCFNAKELWMYSPFIRVNKIKELLDDPSKCRAIVVRWQTMDLLVGVTDFEELFNFCNDHNISLFRNTRIHLKAIRNEKNHIHFGSANFTNMGMGINGNIELSGINTDKNIEDINYLNSILDDSKTDEITEDYFKALKIDVDEKKEDFKKIKKIKDKDIATTVKKKFLLDSLPQSESPELLWKIMNSGYNVNTYSVNEIRCAKHDIQSYANEEFSKKSKEEFLNKLASGFNTTPFIYELKSMVRAQINYKMGYTQITKWISKTTLSVPTPSRHDIKDKRWVNRLHNWIPFLDQVNYKSEKRHKIDGGSGGTNFLHYIGNDHGNDYKDLRDLMGSLRINKKGGKSPHQFILLSSINELVKNKKQDFSIIEIEGEFSKQWSYAEKLNQRAKKNFAMPLNALRGKLIKFNFINNGDNIQNYRKESELKEKVSTITIGKSLMILFSNQEITSEEILKFYKKTPVL